MDYPVMLYRDGFDDWAIADDDEHEAELLKSGFTTHADFMAKDKNGNSVLRYDAMTNKELQKLLDHRGVDYVARDSKDALIQRAKDSE